MSFWDTVKGRDLADVLIYELPRLIKKMNLIVQTNLELKKPDKQDAAYVKKDKLQEYVKERIDKGYSLVSIIHGESEADDILVIMKF